MRIAVIGTGNVGGALGTRWAQGGHNVIFASRDPESEKARTLLLRAGPSARVTTLREAVADAEIVVLATPWQAAQETLTAAGDLSGKIVIDATNPLKDMKLAVGHTTSAGEQVAVWATDARVVKAFNNVGAGTMADADYRGQKPTTFICGDDAQAKHTVAQLAEELGFEVVDAGPLTSARYLEPLAVLWITLAYSQGMGPNIAFKLLRR